MPHPEGDKHHYIPKFYLKQWVGADGRLSEFTRPHKDVVHRRKVTDATGYKRGLYTFEMLPPALANYIEHRFLQYSDNAAYAALRKMVGGDLSFDAFTQNAFSRFIMTLLHRNPEGIERLTVKFDTEFRQNVEEFRPQYEELRKSRAGPTFDAFISGLTPRDLQGFTLQALTRVMDSELVGQKFNSMIWSIVGFDDSHHPLLTGDRPIVMTNGLNQQDSHMLMPLSPRVIFIAANEEPEIRRLQHVAEHGGLAQMMNNRIARQARKYVYAIDVTPLGFVAARLGEKASWSPFE